MWPWGVGLALAAAVAGGYALWLGVRKLLARRSTAPRPSSPAQPQGAGPLLKRGEAAVARLRAECSSPTDPVLLDQVSDFDDQAAAILVDLQHSADQVVTIERSLREIPVDQLRQTLATTTAKLADATDPGLRSELEHVERSLTDQLAVAQRLDGARRTLLARIEAAVLDIEGLSARVAELVVMHDMVGESQTADRLAELTDDVDGMRAGLAEARRLSGGIVDSDPDPVPVPAPVPAEAPAPPLKKDPKRPGRPRWDIVTGVVAVVLIATCAANEFVPHRFGPAASTGAGGGSGCVETIGFLGVLSGSNDGDGQTEYDAVELAVDQDNAAHPECEVQIQKFDTNGDTGAVDAAKLIKNAPDVLGVIGPTYGSEAEDALPILDPLGVPVISPSASASALTNGRFKVFHRTLPSDDDQADAGVRYLTTGLKKSRTFVIADDSVYGQDAGPLVAGRLKGTLAGQATTTTEATDFGPLVKQVGKAKADSVYFAGLGGDGGLFVKALRATGSVIPVIGGDQLITTSFLDGAGDAAENMMATCPCVPTTTGVSTFAAQYKAQYDDSAGYYAPEAYDAANVLLAGLRKGRTTRATLLAWVNAYSADGVSRHVQFTPAGDVSATGMKVWVYTVKKGSYTPTDIAP